MKYRLLEAIEFTLLTLDPLDVDGHIWWGKFKEFVKSFEDD